MGKIDKQKEIISFWRSLFFFFLGSMFALIAFIFTKYDKLSDMQLIIADIAGGFLLVGTIGAIVKLHGEIEKIGDIE